MPAEAELWLLFDWPEPEVGTAPVEALVEPSSSSSSEAGAAVAAVVAPPPLPPPPPTDWAKMPAELMPVVLSVPKFSTVTRLAAPPPPPDPPSPKESAPDPPLSTVLEAAPPLPPPPPTDWAKIAADCRPLVVMLPVFTTVAVDPAPPPPPVPPRLIDPA